MSRNYEACVPCNPKTEGNIVKTDESVQAWLERAQATLSECEARLARLNIFLNAKCEPEGNKETADCLVSQARNISWQSNRIYSQLMDAMREIGVNG